MLYDSKILRTIFTTCSALIGLVWAENLTVDQTSQLKLEITLIGIIFNNNHVTPLSALKNVIFSLVGTTQPIRPTSGQLGPKV